VEDAIRVVRPLAERKGLYLEVHLPADGLPTILADRVRLRQVMLNLLTNAVRFTQQGGITVDVTRRPDSVLVSIQDTGRGISSDELPRLFEEFSQLHLTEGDSVKGTGLGLAISKHLIELHGGRIWAESQENVGTRFYFTLPLPETTPTQPRHSRPTDSPLPARPHDVCLVLHRDPAIVRLLARYLEGYHVIGVPREHDLLPLIHDYYPRAVVAPPPSAEHVRAALAVAQVDVPVISCSMPQLTQGPQVEGALSYLMKPVTREMVEATIRQVQWNGKEMNVLVVDDDPDTVRLLEIMLTSTPEAPRVWKAYDGQQALEIMQTRVPDLIFIDLLMPGLDGERTIAQMRIDHRLRAVPVVVVSARDMVGDTATLGTHIGVYSQRPVSITEGVKRLQALLDALTPRYLPEVASDVPSPAAFLG
jgi:CheY-like chemotaxis protein